MADYGVAVMKRNDDGTITVESADDVIGISVALLAAAIGEGLWVSGDGLLWLAGDPRYQYRPVRFECMMNGLRADQAVEGTRMLICERVNTDG